MDHRYLNDAEIAIVNSEAEDLQSQLEFLNNKVKELEARNAELSFLVANCRCHKMEENFETDVVDRIGLVDHMKRVKLGSGDNTKKKSSKYIDGGCKTRVAYHPSKRYVALKVIYFGQRFYGFASEAQMDPTVESEIFKALKKTRLVFGNKKDWKYSRCGRTDKGVSSVGQVIALFLRSNHKEKAGSTGNSGDFVTEDLYEGELDYVRILNKVLPKDIRVIGWCPAPTDFSARFSCRVGVQVLLLERQSQHIDMKVMSSGQ